MADSVEQTFQHEDFESGVEREFKFLIKKLLKISFFSYFCNHKWR